MATQISYHVSWPGADPYHVANPTDVQTRRGHYIVNAVPYIRIDGVNAASWQDAITNNSALPAPLGISIGGVLDYSGVSQCEVTLTPESGVNGEYTLHVVLVEDNLYYMGANGYPNHHHVMRKMYPDGAGTTITLTENVPSTETVEMEIPIEFEMDNCRLVVFVQNNSNGVLNAATRDLTDITPVNVPALSIISEAIEVLDLDDDEKLSPGESANFHVTLQNRCGWIEGTNVTAYLSSTNPAVTIDDSVGTFTDLAACSTGSNATDKFSFTVVSDAPRVNEIAFNLRITANQDGEVPYEINETLYIEMNMYQVHFPVQIDHGVVSGNAVINLDGDEENEMEIVFGGMDSMLHVLTAAGVEASGFPFTADNKITSAPAIGDVDNDGDLEIVAVTVSGGVYVVEADGSGSMVAQAEDNILGTPAIADLDGDNDLEIVIAGFGYDLIVMHHDGTPLVGFPIILEGERMEGAAAIADIDGDGAKDIIVGTKSDHMHVFDVNGNSLPGFPVDLGRDIKTAPVITDLTGDGVLEIISGQRSGVVYALSSTGTVLWTHQLAAVPILVPPAVFDYNLDGLMETVYVLPDGRVSVLDHAGMMLEGWPQSLSTTCYSAPILADIDEDDVPEIILGDDANMLYAFNIDGSLVAEFPMALDARVHAAATIEDVDQDDNLEIVVGTDGGMSVIDLPVTGSGIWSWYTSRGDYQRTGYFANNIESSLGQLQRPNDMRLSQNYPNPFNPSTTIRFSIPEVSSTQLTVYDVKGNELATLLDSRLSPGEYALIWEGTDDLGKTLPTGIYLARLRSGHGEQIIKMMFLK